MVSDPTPALSTVAPDVPRALEAIVAKATALNPDDRYDSAQEMRVALEDIAPSYNQGIIDYINELNVRADGIRGCQVDLEVGEGDNSAIATEQVIAGWQVAPEWPEVSTLFVFGTSSVKRVAKDLADEGKLVIAGASSGSLASPVPISRDVVHPLVGADGTKSSVTEEVNTAGYPNVFFLGMDDSTIARALMAEISSRGGGRVALVADVDCAFCVDPLAAIRQQIGSQARLELGRDVQGVEQSVRSGDEARVQTILDDYFQWEIDTKLADPDYQPVSWLWLGNGVVSSSLVGRAVAQVQDMVVKVTGIPWFNRLGQGVSEAASDLGINAIMVGPSEGDDLAEEQVRIVEGLIADNYGAIGIVPQDTDLLDPVIERAREAGIVVITHESPSPRRADWDIETIDNTAYAERVFTHMAELMDGEGQSAVFVGGFDVGLHNLWADQGLEFVQKKYPGMTLVTARAEDREPCGEDAEACYEATNKLLVEFPDLKGIAAFGSQGPIGAGRALRDLDRNDVNVVGAAIPSQVGQLLEDGHVKAAFLWDPRDAGYAMIAVAHRMLDGGDLKTETNYPRLGEASVNAEEKNIIFDRILEITAENAGDLGF